MNVSGLTLNSKFFLKLDMIEGLAKFVDNDTISVNNTEIKATNYIIATGSRAYDS